VSHKFYGPKGIGTHTQFIQFIDNFKWFLRLVCVLFFRGSLCSWWCQTRETTTWSRSWKWTTSRNWKYSFGKYKHHFTILSSIVKTNNSLLVNLMLCEDCGIESCIRNCNEFRPSQRARKYNETYTWSVRPPLRLLVQYDHNFVVFFSQ
jgi:hypothetical protein